MDTQALEAFTGVARTGSFSQAAEQLFLTQPAVSKRISQLEASLNTRLFDRYTRHIQLTEAGRALLPRAEAILQDLKDTERLIRNLSGSISGRLSIGTSHHIGLHYLPPVLRQFRANHSQVSLSIQFFDSEQAYKAIQKGEIELACITLPNTTKDSSLYSHEVLWPDPLCFVASYDHPLTTKKSVDLTEIATYDAILPADNTVTHRVVAQLFQSHKLNITPIMETNYLETIKMMVAVGLGWSILPIKMVDSQQIHTIPVEAPSMERRLGITYASNRTLSNAAQAFIDIAKQH